MAHPSRSRSIAETSHLFDSRFDSSLYFDGEPSKLEPQGTWSAGVNRYRPHFFDHFLGKSLHPRWNLQDTSSGGTPTSAAVDAVDGLWSLKLASTSETETYGINFGDVLNYTPPVIARFGFTMVAAPASANRMIIGLGSAHNNTLDSIASNAWFKLDADANLVVESDDGTTDVDDTDTGIDLVDGQLIHCRIEILAPGQVFFFAGTGSTSTPKRVVSGTTFAVSASQRLQPMAILSRDSGGTQNDLRICYFGVYGNRG